MIPDEQKRDCEGDEDKTSLLLNQVSYHTPDKSDRVWRISPAILVVIALVLGIFILLPLLVIWSISAPSSVTFHVVNYTSFPINSFVFTSPQGSSELGPIKPGETRNIKVKTAYNFSYKYSGKINGQLITGVAARWIDDDAEGYSSTKNLSIQTSADGSVVVRPW